MKTFKALFIDNGIIKAGEFPVEPASKASIYADELAMRRYEQAFAEAKANAVVVEDQDKAMSFSWYGRVPESKIVPLPSGWDYRVVKRCANCERLGCESMLCRDPHDGLMSYTQVAVLIRTDEFELKPCPFCAGPAHYIVIDAEDDDPNAGGEFIECQTCRASTNIMFPIQEDVSIRLVEKWNTRPDTSRISELEARIKELEDANQDMTESYIDRVKELNDRIAELEAENKQLEIKVLDMQDDRSKLREAEHFIDLQKLTLRDLEAENKRLREEQRWIPVTERLPESDDNVLCLTSTGNVIRFAQYRAYAGQWYYYFSNVGLAPDDRLDREMTHWMPLPPQPPKEQ